MDINILRAFVHVVDAGSFAEAARRMGISRSLCSKHIADLEAHLGARLLTRTTRKLALTAIGVDYCAQLRSILERLDQATETARSAAQAPSGELKIGSPVFYTLKVLQPHLLNFMERFPDIRLQIVLDDGSSDLIGDGFDAVIRIGQLKDSSLHARRLDWARIVMVAAPEYIARHGQPEKPHDLMHHDCLHYTNLAGTGSWPLSCGAERFWQKVRATFSSNNTELLHSMAISGKGVALLPEFIIRDEVASGKLVPLLTDYSLPDIPVNLVYPSSRLISSAMRSFLDFAAGMRLAQPPA